MSEPDATTLYDVTCPHCRKGFTASLIEGAAARYRGFKCPHCKLFIPWERVSGVGEPGFPYETPPVTEHAV